ncbi:hypothetical protein [Virgibacillus siamensis]|uniref:hypothetical protein n=1 Tax=Virgibacillus siamensis TaxID=480071 RepID=UPI0015893FEC|nr:hypothetical protein [Virgibacillus siamensis]
MIEVILDFMLGPFWRAVGDFYFQHQMILNSIVVGAALCNIFFKKKKVQHESEAGS